MRPTRPALRGLPRGIWVLGLVSLCMDLSSEMIHAVLPLFLTVGLGASATAFGWIAGLGEATASLAKLGSGALSDRLGRRKQLAALGYGLSAASKPLFALAPGVAWVAAARFVDRVGKGVRGPPRDALLAELAPPGQRGASYGLRQALDTLGACAGPLLAAVLLWTSASSLRAVLWIAGAPACLSLALICFGVREPDGPPLRAPGPRMRRADLAALGPAYGRIVALASALMLARLSEGFLILRAQSAGLPLALAPLALVVLNASYALSAYPLGRLSDRIPRARVLAAGCAALAAAQVALALARDVPTLALGAALWGLHLGMSEGLFAAWIADAAPAELRGTAFGLFNLASGAALLASGAGAGWIWERFGAPAAFLAGASLSVLVLACALLAPQALRVTPPSD